MREILNRNFPGVEFLQWPGGLVASVFSNGYIAPLVVEVRGDNLEELDAQVAGGRRGRAHACPASATSTRRCRSTTPSCASRPTATRGRAGRRDARAAPRRPRSRRRSATSTRPASGSTARNGQSYYVVTSYDGRVVDDPDALARIPVRIGDERRRGHARRLRHGPPLGRPDRHRAQPPAARRRTC